MEDATDTLCIVMEYANGGDLYCYLLQQKQYLSEKRIWAIFIQVLKGLKVLHDQQILHRDLKTSNVFLTKEGCAKLGDFNVSKKLKGGMLRTQAGTPYYASPEVWSGRPYNYKSDIWSLGCILYELCTLKQPFKAEDMRSLRQKVCKGLYPPIPKHCSSKLSGLVKQLLHVNPLLRPELGRVMETCAGPIRSPEGVKKVSGLKRPILIHGCLLGTIKVPKNLRILKKRLPKANYDNSSRGISLSKRVNGSITNEELRYKSARPTPKRQEPKDFIIRLSKENSRIALNKENIQSNKYL